MKNKVLCGRAAKISLHARKSMKMIIEISKVLAQLVRDKLEKIAFFSCFDDFL
jgi:hypothetical protein